MFLLFRSPLPRIPDAATAAFLPSAGGPGEGESADHVLTEYYVVGPTGTVYSIKLTNLPSCNCPDNTKARPSAPHTTHATRDTTHTDLMGQWVVG